MTTPTQPENANPDLTPRQAAVLGFIRSFIAKKGWAPSIREIGEHFGIASPHGVVCHLDALQKKGAIYREAGPRMMRVLD